MTGKRFGTDTGPGANTDPKLSLIRNGATRASQRYTAAGRKRRMPPITLPKLKCLEPSKDDEL